MAFSIGGSNPSLGTMKLEFEFRAHHNGFNDTWSGTVWLGEEQIYSFYLGPIDGDEDGAINRTATLFAIKLSEILHDAS